METPTLTINQQFLCKENYIMDSKKIGFKKGNIYKIDAIKVELDKILMTFKSEIFDEHLMYFDTEFKQHFELAEKTYTLTETFIKELCKEPNIKEAFVREGIVEEEKLEVGKWYKHKYGGFLFGTNIENGKVISYGFYSGMEWYDKDYFSENVIEFLTLATPKEVETALISEAKKRELTPENLKNINCVSKWNNDSNQEYYDKLSKYKYEHLTNSLWLVDGSNLSICLFDNGTWAEIIEETRTIEIPLKDILATPNSYELGEMVRKLANEKL